MKTIRQNTYLILAQLTVVLIWYAITVVQWVNNPKYDIDISIPLLVRGIEAISIFIICAILIFIFEKLKLKPGVINRIFILIALYGVSILTNFFSIWMRKIYGYAPPPIERYFFIQSLHFYIPILLVVITYATYKSRFEVHEAREKKLEAEALAQQANWMMLRYQVNPHFLFNALNSVRALIGTNNENAKNTITAMSEYFRYTLKNEHNSITTIKEEIEAVQNYLSIQKIRFQDDIQISYNIDPGTFGIEIPAFTIQILVENAVKYGFKTSPKPIQINIQTTSGEPSKIIVTNSGTLYKHDNQFPESTNTGLQNLRKRLKLIGRHSDFKIEEKNSRVYATISISKTNNYE